MAERDSSKGLDAALEGLYHKGKRSCGIGHLTLTYT
jgi:hypothetical protein